MDPLWVFMVKYEELRDLSGAIDEKRYLQLSACLRAFLLEGEKIADLVNKKFGITVLFDTRRELRATMLPVGSQSVTKNEVFFSGPPEDGSPITKLSIDAFRKVHVLSLLDKSYSIDEIVVTGANVAGGVHSRADPKNEYLNLLAGEIFLRERRVGLESLKVIATYVLRVYHHLFTLSEGTSVGFAQLRPERMPWVVLADPAGAMQFDGSQFFESGLPGGVTANFVVLLQLALRDDANAAERFVFDVGPIDGSAPRFSICQKRATVYLRYLAAPDIFAETPPLRLKNKRFCTLLARIYDEPTGVRLSIQARGATNTASIPGVRAAAPSPSRLSLGASINKQCGALMQVRSLVMAEAPADSFTDAIAYYDTYRPRSWVTSTSPPIRAVQFNNQMRNN